MNTVHTLYYTDPVCPWSWAFEPSFRAFEGQLEIEYVVCGCAGRSKIRSTWRFAIEWRVTAEPILSGEVWSPA